MAMPSKKQAGLMLGQTDMHNNLVYPLLRRFVREGLVTQKKAAGERGQTRQVYSLTARGPPNARGASLTISTKPPRVPAINSVCASGMFSVARCILPRGQSSTSAKPTLRKRAARFRSARKWNGYRQIRS